MNETTSEKEINEVEKRKIEHMIARVQKQQVEVVQDHEKEIMEIMIQRRVIQEERQNLHELILMERDQFKDRLKDLEVKERELEAEEIDFEGRF